MGGGLVVAKKSSLHISGCTFEKNIGDTGGLWFDNDDDEPGVIDRCIFVGNQTPKDGGGVGVRGPAFQQARSTIVVRNCLLAGNVAREGGGIFVLLQSADVNSSTIVGNVARVGGGGVFGSNEALLSLTNSILWQNQADTTSVPFKQLDYHSVDTVAAAACDIEGVSLIGSYWGRDVIDDDPKFIAGPGKDGAWGSSDDDLRLSPGSRCIDAGTGTAEAGVDVAGVPRWLDGDLDGSMVIDIGAEEFCNVSVSVEPLAGGKAVNIEAAVPLIGFVCIGRNEGSEMISPFGSLLIAKYPPIIRIEVGTLPVSLSVPMMYSQQQDFGCVLQVLAVTPDGSAGTSRSVSVWVNDERIPGLRFEASGDQAVAVLPHLIRGCRGTLGHDFDCEGRAASCTAVPPALAEARARRD